MNKDQKRLARQRVKEENLRKTLGSLRPGVLEDINLRGMNSYDGVIQYFTEIKEVNAATIRMRGIDQKIRDLSDERREQRSAILKEQRKALTGEDLALLSM